MALILGIYGAGGLGREVFDTALVAENAQSFTDSIVFIDDFSSGSQLKGTKVYTFDGFKAAFAPDTARIVVAVGEPKVRRSLRQKALANGFALQTLIHPNACIGSDAVLGNGTIVQYGSFVSCNVQVGENVLIQPNAAVGHDSVIGHDTVLSTFVAVSGTCTIGEGAYIGVGVAIREGISIGAGTIIGLGSAVLRDIPADVVALGNPARPMKNNERGKVFN
jgi:sugar O-acyltransferase (sialic acid O-acetyltransferase NeuD family)